MFDNFGDRIHWKKTSFETDLSVQKSGGGIPIKSAGLDLLRPIYGLIPTHPSSKLKFAIEGKSMGISIMVINFC